MLPLSPGDHLLPVPSAIEKATGYRPHPTTCTRWTRKGVRGVKLETVQVGGRPRTTEQAVLDFIRRQTEAERGLPPSDSNSAPPRGESADSTSAWPADHSAVIGESGRKHPRS